MSSSTANAVRYQEFSQLAWNAYWCVKRNDRRPLPFRAPTQSSKKKNRNRQLGPRPTEMATADEVAPFWCNETKKKKKRKEEPGLKSNSYEGKNRDLIAKNLWTDRLCRIGFSIDAIGPFHRNVKGIWLFGIVRRGNGIARSAPSSLESSNGPVKETIKRTRLFKKKRKPEKPVPVCGQLLKVWFKVEGRPIRLFFFVDTPRLTDRTSINETRSSY